MKRSPASFTSALLLGIVALSLLVPSAASAGAHVRNLDIFVAPAEDGWVRVTEEFEYDFEDTRSFFIEREIPTTRSVDNRTWTQNLAVQSVSDSHGVPQPYRVELSHGIGRIIIGDEMARATGRHSVRIVYDLSGVVHFTSHGEVFFLDVTGNGWRVPIDQARVRVAVPGDPTANIECARFFGPNLVGACESSVGEPEVEFSLVDLRPSESIRIRIGVPAGTFSRRIAPLRFLSAASTKLGLWALLPLCLLGLIYMLRRRTSTYDDEVEGCHNPPERLGPAETAAVLNTRVDAVAFLATVVDLARRGHLQIRRVRSERGVFALSADDWQLTHSPDGDAIRDYEIVVLAALLDGEDERLLSAARTSIGRHFREFRHHVYRTLRSDGRAFHTHPEKLDRRLRLVALGCGVIGVVGLVLSMPRFGLAWLATALLTRLFSHLIPLHTARGLKLRGEVKGFRVFARSATKAQLIEHGAWNVRAFESLLPYALAVGEADAWAGRYDDPYVSGAPKWMPDVNDPLGELGDFLTILRATVVGLPVRDAAGGVLYSGRYSEGPFA